MTAESNESKENIPDVKFKDNFHVKNGELFLKEIQSSCVYKWSKEKKDALVLPKVDAEKAAFVSPMFKIKKV